MDTNKKNMTVYAEIVFKGDKSYSNYFYEKLSTVFQISVIA